MSKSSKLPYFWCIVPMCTNTSIKTPEKIFIQVPLNEKRRKLWFTMVRRDPREFSKISCVFVCEDHFDLENDMENYWRWKIIGGLKIMKPDVVPHKFECLVEKELTFSEKIPRKAAVKRRRLQEIEEALPTPSTSKILTIDNISINLSIVPKEHVQVPQIKPKYKNFGVTVRPSHLTKQTQTVHKDFPRSSAFECVCKSTGTSPFEN